MKRPTKKPKCTDELAYQVQYVGKPRGWTERYQAALHGVSTATIRRAKSMTVSRETLERHARPAPRQSAADAAKLVALLSAEPEPEADEPMVEWLADLLAADVADGADVVLCMLPAALSAELAREEHVVSALACLALVSADDGELEREPHIAAARDLLVAAAGELAAVHSAHFSDDESEES